MTENPTATPQIEALLAEEDFVRGLARRLVRDAATADDVVQQAWVRAIERPPRRAGPLRHWLALVVRNLVRDRHRAEARAAALRPDAPDAVPSTEAVLHREEQRRRVVEAVLSLPEPYRGAVLLRFFEDLTPREIAARLDVPASTVRTRLQRGLEMLRGRLDADFGSDRRAFCLALIPLARPRLLPLAAGAAASTPVIAWFTLGGLTMKKTATAAIAAVLLFAGGLALTMSGAGTPEVELPDGAAERVAAAVAPPAPERAPLPASPAPAVTREAAAARPEVAEVSGTLHAADGARVAGSPYWFQPGQLEVEADELEAPPPPSRAARTDAKGRFSLPLRTRRPAERMGLLWFAPAAGIRVACVVAPWVERDWRRVELPRTGKARFEGYDLPAPPVRFRVALTPARPLPVEQPRGAAKRALSERLRAMLDAKATPVELRRVRDVLRGRAPRHEPVATYLVPQEAWRQKPAHPDALLALATTTPQLNGTRGTVDLLHGVSYAYEVSGYGFAVTSPVPTPEAGPPVVAAGDTIRFRGAGRIPWGHLSVYESDGRRTDLPGRVTLGPPPGKGRWRGQIDLRGGRAPLGHNLLKPDTTARLWVTMADGELFERELAVQGDGEQAPVELFRGQGLRPTLVSFHPPPPGPGLGRVRLYAEDSRGRLVEGIRWNELDFADGGSAVGYSLFGFGEDGVVRLIRPPADLTHLWLLSRRGHVATSNGPSGQWLPVRPLQPLDLDEEYRKHAVGRRAEVEFQVELVLGSGRRTWRTLDHVAMHTDTGLPIWEKVAPARLAWRFQMRVDRQPPFELDVPPR